MRETFPRRPGTRRIALIMIAVCAVALSGARLPARAQGSFDYQSERKRAVQLFGANNFVESLPIFERLYAANQSDVIVLEDLSFILAGNLRSIQDQAERAKVRERALSIARRARELGDNSNLLMGTLAVLEAPDAGGTPFTSKREAEAAMNEGEAAFSRGDMDKAIEAYQRALKLDPTLYYAALFTGDSYFKKRDYKNADQWFARAVEINPDIETAHRYWGDSLVAQGKKDEARDKFIAAIVASPGDRQAYVGLTQWADKYGVKLAHPEIQVPTSVSDQDGKTTINLDMSALMGNKDNDDGGFSWIAYGATRADWSKEKFAKEFPQERAYRHTLREEAEALHAVADMARQQLKDGKIKKLSPSLANLVKLDEAGLLEPYVFYTRVDRGIAQDYAAYRREHRDKLQRYWAEFVVREK